MGIWMIYSGLPVAIAGVVLCRNGRHWLWLTGIGIILMVGGSVMHSYNPQH